MRAKGMSEEDANTKLHYVCDICGKDFSSLGAMQKHVKHVHERFYENIQCDLCGSIFKTSQLCKQHHEKVIIVYSTQYTDLHREHYTGGVI